LKTRGYNIETEGIGKQLETMLADFQPISLDDLGDGLLRKRFDIKFVVPQNTLLHLVPALANDFNILNIDGRRQFHYSTQYFDTYDYKFYYKHHNGVQNRKKIRYRTYLDSGISFLEIKHKINGSFIKKTRIPIPIIDKEFCDESVDFIQTGVGLSAGALVPKLMTKFQRITLQHKSKDEKITIDRNVYFKNTVKDYSLSSLAVIEVKQSRKDSTSGIIKLLRETGNTHPISFSKYCIGLAITDEKVKYNNFKRTLLYLNKISGELNEL